MKICLFGALCFMGSIMKVLVRTCFITIRTCFLFIVQKIIICQGNTVTIMDTQLANIHIHCPINKSSLTLLIQIAGFVFWFCSPCPEISHNEVTMAMFGLGLYNEMANTKEVKINFPPTFFSPKKLYFSYTKSIKGKKCRVSQASLRAPQTNPYNPSHNRFTHLCMG